jgi:hypothetical protein
MVTRLDRLARSTRDLLNTLAAIAGKGAGFRSLGDTWADTTKIALCGYYYFLDGASLQLFALWKFSLLFVGSFRSTQYQLVSI